MIQSTNIRHHIKQKQDLVSQIFGDKLAHEDLKEAFRICEEDFGENHEFTASDFCQRLATTRPEVEIGRQTRLLLLRGVRQQGTKSETQSAREPQPLAAITPTARHATSQPLKSILTERRRELRKTTDLIGVYWHTSDKQQTGAMTVENLSLGGCGIRILTPHELKRGDELRLEFKLDNAAETFIRIRGQLRWVLYDLAGIEFHSSYARSQALVDYIES